MADLITAAQSAIQAALYKDSNHTTETLREAALDAVPYEVDNACTYYHQCEDIISDYEAEFGIEAEDACAGKTFDPTEWRSAMATYAAAIADCAIRSKIEDLLSDIDTASGCLLSAAQSLTGNTDISEDDLRLSESDPFGHFAPTEIDGDGVYIFIGGQCDGANALSVSAGGIWISYAWDAPHSDT